MQLSRFLLFTQVVIRHLLHMNYLMVQSLKLVILNTFTKTEGVEN